MLLMGTQLLVYDNSGARKVNFIQNLSTKGNRNYLGDKLVVSIRKTNLRTKVQKGSVQHAILIGKRNRTYRKHGLYLSFFDNIVVLVKKKSNVSIHRIENEPIGNRIKGGVPLELRYKKSLKLITLASHII